MNNSQELGQFLPSINLDNMDFRDHQMILTSPRSINICKKHGVDLEDLYFYNFYEFREMHPELNSLGIEIQKSHYFHDKEAREVLLSKLRKERKELIEKEYEMFIKQNKFQKEDIIQKEFQKKKNSKNLNLKNLPKNENERIREKEKRKLINMLEANLRTAYLQKENELKSELEKNKRND